MSTEKYLLIVDGKETEKSIFENLFKLYGFNVIKSERKLSKYENLHINESLFELENKNIILIEGPKNRIHDILINTTSSPEEDINNIDVEALFGYNSNDFYGIFWIYDVDHNDNEDVEKMFSKFNDESENGLLLLSSPCVEVLSDYNIARILKCEHIREYKRLLNDYWNKNGYKNAKDYINCNISNLLVYFLDKNVKDFNDENIMNHPSEIIEFINKNNTRDNDKGFVEYRYFSTVVYTVLGFVSGLTKKINNYSDVRNYIIKNQIRNTRN